MARNKNKGFSLIEIIVAIAIMTLLLTPIIKQLAQTMAVNRQAKEQQYANENAEYVLEYFQANSIKTIGPDTPAPSPDPGD
ncbi:MAG: prepilin-type N-terminal cleavage/methylation domain-containing protein, partial [Wujia sp.]